MSRWHSALFLTALVGLSVLHGKEKEPTIRPSFAKPVKAVVFNGGEVRITLSATTPVGGTKYLLRSLPSRGTLGEIAVTEQGLASVTYRHAGGGAGEDSFTYAVQSPGAAVSSRASVLIHVANRPAQVVLPEVVDFGRVPVGASSRRVIVLKNSGGEKFAGRIRLASPWECEAGRAEIPPGGASEVALDFSPDGVCEYSGTYFLEGPGGASGALTGEGFAVFEVSTKFLKLRESADGSRSAELSVANKTDEPMTVEFVCPPGILVIAPVTIPPNGSVGASVAAEDTQKSAVRASFVVKERRVSTTVEVSIPPAPARLVIEPATAINFGNIAPGSSAAREMMISNTGGVPTAVELVLPPWIRADPDRILLKPGKQQTFRLEAAGARPGDLRDRIVLKSDAGFSELAVMAKVLASATPAPTPPPISQAPEAPSLKPLRITQISQGNGSVTVTWTNPNPGIHTFRIESLRITSEASLARQAVLALNVEDEKFRADEFAAERLRLGMLFEQASKNDQVVKIWSPLEKSKVSEIGTGTFEVTFPMPSDPVTRIRILMVLPEGSTSPVVSEIRIPLRHPKPPGPPMALIAVAVVGILGGIVLFLRRYRLTW